MEEVNGVDVMAQFRALWKAIQRNPYFVVPTSAAFGAVLSILNDEFLAGKLDFTPDGIRRLKVSAVGAIIIALYHLYLDKPGSNPNPNR